MVGASYYDYRRLWRYGTQNICWHVCWRTLCSCRCTNDSVTRTSYSFQFCHVLFPYSSPSQITQEEAESHPCGATDEAEQTRHAGTWAPQRPRRHSSGVVWGRSGHSKQCIHREHEPEDESSQSKQPQQGDHGTKDGE
uniref:Uncharacterized protein n=2 Tax=Cacopsylla melanoneura TaxID=428564 RepID=A0A8D8WBY5_9HEMI